MDSSSLELIHRFKLVLLNFYLSKNRYCSNKKLADKVFKTIENALNAQHTFLKEANKLT